MIVLTIETCFAEASLALYVDGSTYYRHESQKNMHTEKLPIMLEDILQEAGLEFANITHIVVNIGPGSFAGIRIGISFMMGLCFESNIIPCGIGIMDAISSTSPSSTIIARAIRDTFYIQKHGILEYITIDELRNRFDVGESYIGYDFASALPLSHNVSDDIKPNAKVILEAFLKSPEKYFNITEPIYLRGI